MPTAKEEKQKAINWNQLSELGLIVKINKEILHPVGLAVSRNPKTGVSEKIYVADDGVWTYDNIDNQPNHSVAELKFKIQQMIAPQPKGSNKMSYTILADPIRGWGINHKGQKIGLNKKRKSGLTRIKKYRKMLKSHKIDFKEVFVPAGVKHFSEELKELEQKFTEYDPCQDLYIFIF